MKKRKEKTSDNYRNITSPWPPQRLRLAECILRYPPWFHPYLSHGVKTYSSWFYSYCSHSVIDPPSLIPPLPLSWCNRPTLIQKMHSTKLLNYKVEPVLKQTFTCYKSPLLEVVISKQISQAIINELGLVKKQTNKQNNAVSIHCKWVSLGDLLRVIVVAYEIGDLGSSPR